MMNVSTNLITKAVSVYQPIVTKKQDVQVNTQVQNSSNLLTQYLDNMAKINAPAVSKPVEVTSVVHKPYKNDLRTLFLTNSAKILAMIPRTFNAKDTNNNEYIDGNEQHGTFLNAIERLDEVKAQGFNTLHVLPINPPGKNNAM